MAGLADACHIGRRATTGGRRKRLSPRTDTAPAASVRRSDGEIPCRDHPLDQGKSDQALAGFLAHGSKLDARLPRRELVTNPLPSGCARPHISWGRRDARLAHRLQLQGQLRIWMAPKRRPHRIPILSPEGRQRDLGGNRRTRFRQRPYISISRTQSASFSRRKIHLPKDENNGRT